MTKSCNETKQNKKHKIKVKVRNHKHDKTISQYKHENIKMCNDSSITGTK